MCLSLLAMRISRRGPTRFCGLWEGLLAYQFVEQGWVPCRRDVCYLRRRILCRFRARLPYDSSPAAEMWSMSLEGHPGHCRKSPFRLPTIVRSSCGA